MIANKKHLMRKLVAVGIFASVAMTGGITGMLTSTQAYAFSDTSIEENVTEYDISLMSADVNTGIISILIDTDGTYLFKGSNYRETGGGCYIDVQVTVANGVEADIILDGLDISNRAYVVDCGDFGVDNAPFIIDGIANVYVKSHSELDIDASAINTTYDLEGSSYMFTGKGTVNFMESQDKAMLSMLMCRTNVALEGAFVDCKGFVGYEDIDGNDVKYSFSMRDGYLKTGSLFNYDSNIVIGGGYCAIDKNYQNIVDPYGEKAYKSVLAGLPADAQVVYVGAASLEHTYTDGDGKLVTYLPDLTSDGIILALDNKLYLYEQSDITVTNSDDVANGAAAEYLFSDPAEVVDVGTLKFVKVYDGQQGIESFSESGALEVANGVSAAVNTTGVSFTDTAAGSYTVCVGVDIGYNGKNYIGYLDVPAQIDQRDLSITAADVEDKAYDGTTTAIVKSVTFDGIVTGETVSYSAVGEFSDAEVGTDKTVTVTVTLDDNNYSLNNSTFEATADITAVGVAAPVFSPVDGTKFSGSQEVTITCDTVDAKIYYTTDGTEPTAASSLYEGVFTISKTTVVKAFASCDGYIDSEIVTAKYVKTSSGGSGGGGYYPGGATIVTELPEFNDEKMPWTQMKSAIEKQEKGSAAKIDLNRNYDVPSYIIKAIKDRELKVTFEIDEVRSWYIDGADIEEIMSADLRVTEMASHRVKGLGGTLAKVYGTDGANIPAKLTVKLGGENAGKYAFVYRITDDGYAFSEKMQLDANGAAVGLDLTEKGEYVIMLRETGIILGDINDDGFINKLDADMLLSNIVYDVKTGAEVADYNHNNKVNVLDAAAILIAIKNGEI